MSDEFPIFYFGCIEDKGHYLWQKEQDGNIVFARYVHPDFANRFGANGTKLDGTFCPPEQSGTLSWMGSQVGPWVIISWWDNSVDHRPGSHSTFVTRHGTHDELFERAKKDWPEVFARQPKVTKSLHIYS
jgi:hypothetical protein